MRRTMAADAELYAWAGVLEGVCQGILLLGNARRAWRASLMCHVFNQVRVDQFSVGESRLHSPSALQGNLCNLRLLQFDPKAAPVTTRLRSKLEARFLGTGPGAPDFYQGLTNL